MEQLIERIAKAGVGAKVLAVLVALAILTVLNYFAIGIPPGQSIVAIDELKTKKEQELKDAAANLGMKRQIANDLNRFRRQRELLQQQFQEARAELPDTNRMDDLLQGFQEKAVKAGLEIAKVEPKPVIPPTSGEFYAKIPLNLQVEGNFHEIATFLDSLGRMQRIVNVSDIVFDSPRDLGGRLVLKAKFTATTFMFVETATAPSAAKAKPKKGTK
jgi:type IV pilus assembly protein PilO